MGNTNAANRLPSRIGVNDFEVFSLDNLPAPSGGEILLPSGNYLLEESIITADAFRVAPGARVEILRLGSGGGQTITYTGTGAAFRASGAGSFFVLDSIDVLLTGNGASVFDINDILALDVERCLFILSGTTPSLGTINGVSSFVTMDTVGFEGFRNGFTLEKIPALLMRNLNLFGDESGNTTFLTINNGVNIGLADFDTISIRGSAADNIFFIDPTLEAAVTITGIINLGGSNFYAAGTIGAFTAVADASFSAETITSVTDSSGVARFNFTAPPTLFVGQEVTIVGFTTNTAYNVTGIITATGAGFFEISSIAFGTNEAGGSFTSDTVTITATANGLSELDRVLLDTTLSVAYDGGFSIYNVLTNSFQINKAFTTTEAGTWNTGSLDQTSPRVNASDNFGEQNSVVVAFGSVNGQSVATSVSDGTYAAIDVTGFADNGITEQFKLTDAVAGIYTFTGLEPISDILTADIWAEKAGATENYRFTTSINGAIPVFATAVYAPMEVKTTKVLTALTLPVQLNPGDTIQIMSAGDGTADSLTITDLLLSLK